MDAKLFNLITGLIFLIVAGLHLCRLIFMWDFIVGPIVFPMWLSWFGFAVALFLSIWSFKIAFYRMK